MLVTMTTINDDLTRRAYAAWFRSGAIDPPSDTSGLVEHDGHRYVVLRNVRGVLAVYRVRNDGVLKRLRRWPDALGAAASPQ